MFYPFLGLLYLNVFGFQDAYESGRFLQSPPDPGFVRQEMDPSSDRCQELLIKIWLPGRVRTQPAYIAMWIMCLGTLAGKHTKRCGKPPLLAPNRTPYVFHLYAD